MAGTEIRIREAVPGDRPAVLAVIGRSLGWPDDERHRAYFEWKHDRSPFGPSFAWVATAGDRVVGCRLFMRWEMVWGDRRLLLARAVDTATDPDFRRQGVFRRLTLAAVEALTSAGVDAVLNLPNDLSRPGYLKMGWSSLGRPTLHVVPRGLRGMVAMARSRTAAAKWSEPAATGRPAVEAVAELGQDEVEGSRTGLDAGWATPRTPGYLLWRYGFEPLGYRAVGVRGGTCVYRVRRRGPSREVAVCEWLSAGRDPAALRRVVRAEGHYAVGIGLSWSRHGAVALPRMGPALTWRPLASPQVPALGDLALRLGDLELF